MTWNFEWDQAKAESNLRKHQISFEEGATVFLDHLSVTLHDTSHSSEEDRYADVGRSSQGRVLVVAYTERGATIRLISCRRATRAERRIYEEGEG